MSYERGLSLTDCTLTCHRLYFFPQLCTVSPQGRIAKNNNNNSKKQKTETTLATLDCKDKQTEEIANSVTDLSAQRLCLSVHLSASAKTYCFVKEKYGW